MRADPIETARRVAGEAYDILGELGREGDSTVAFLARENDTGQLVALTLEGIAEAARLGIKPGFSVRRSLDPSIPAVESRCPRCRSQVSTWARYCPSCSADLSGIGEGPGGGAGARAMAEAATRGKFDLLGEMTRVEGGGPVYFAREHETGRIVALRIDAAASAGSADGPVANVTQWLATLRTGAAQAAEVATPLRESAPARDAPEAPAPPSEPGAEVHVCPACSTIYSSGVLFCPRDGTALRTKTRGQDLAGRVIAGRYRVLARLGAGGMGQVYKAEHIRMGSLCAIKLMNPALERDPEALSRFAREAAHASRISHANVARVYDFGETQDGLLFLAMEFAEGETLSKVIARDGALQPARAAEIARQVADALAAAHELGTVHRDIKPDNIIVNTTRSGREAVKVVDFGIAKALDATPDEQVTRAGFVVGNPKYMSPEQLMGEPTDARGDVYSLGCVLFEMLAGQSAFSASGGPAQLTKRLTEPPPSPRKVEPAVPAELDSIVIRAMARDPEDRFESAAGLRDALSTVLEAITTGRSRIHTDGSWVAVKPPAVAAEPTGEGVAHAANPWLQLRRLLPLAGIALIFVAVVYQLTRIGPGQTAGPDGADLGDEPAATTGAGGDSAAAVVPPLSSSPTAPDRDAGAEPGGTIGAGAGGRANDRPLVQSDPARGGTAAASTVTRTPRTAAIDTPVVQRQPPRTETQRTEPIRVTPPPAPVFRRASADSIDGLLLAVQVRAERREYEQVFAGLRGVRTRLDALLAAFPTEATLRSLDRRVQEETAAIRSACEAWREIQLDRGLPAPECR